MGTSGRATIQIPESAIRQQDGQVLQRVNNYLTQHDRYFAFYHMNDPHDEHEEVKLVLMGEFGVDSLTMLRMIARGDNVAGLLEVLGG